MLNIIAEKLMDELPQGSGIDCDWSYKIQKNGKIVYSNAIHCMDENGYYDGYQDFSLIVDPWDIHNFRIVFHTPRREKYIESWSDCLEEMFAECLFDFEQTLESTPNV